MNADDCAYSAYSNGNDDLVSFLCSRKNQSERTKKADQAPVGFLPLVKGLLQMEQK